MGKRITSFPEGDKETRRQGDKERGRQGEFFIAYSLMTNDQ